MDENHGSSEEEQERPRPRVIDKRVSARPSEPPEPAVANEGAEQPSVEAPLIETSETKGGGQPMEQPSPPQESAQAAPDTEQVWTPEQEAEAQRIAEEIGRVAAADWVLSSVMTLVNVASVKLEQGDTEGSQLAIDALAGILDSVGTRLGPNEGPLRQVLSQLKMAYAEAVMPGPSP